MELVELRVARPAAPVAAAESHLGDRLAAFVDGELDHDARERVQSHLATCDACLATAEDERRTKSRVAAALPPDPSALFLSKLMSIAADQDERPPGGGASQPRRGFGGSAFGGSGSAFGSGTGGFGTGRFGSGALGADHPLPGVDPRAERSLSFHEEQRPIAARLRSAGSSLGSSLVAATPANRPQGHPAQERGAPRPSAARGRRFAFAAAGAFSVAAVALGSAITGVTAAEPTVDEPYGSVTPAAETTGGTVGGEGYGHGTGQLAFGLPANGTDDNEQYANQYGPALFGPSASATALPSGGYPALGSALRR